ncbi:MAG: DUF3368 domain-containing protein [Desulfurococcales archaeon]|nr:DUF3368 domain-containing protein [Desulfurococcales archaeon]
MHEVKSQRDDRSLAASLDKGLLDKSKLVQVLRELKEHGFRISDDIISEVIKRLK